MRQEMSVWCALSSGKCTNSSPLFSFLETMWSSSPNEEWSPPLQTTLFWICLQLFCSFNPHTDIFVLRPVCGVPWLSWDRMWTCQVWPAPRYLPPGLLWLGMCTLKSYRQWQRPSWQPTTSKACFFTTERQSSKWTAPPITDLLMYTNCSLKALLLALFFSNQTFIGYLPAKLKPTKNHTMLSQKLQSIIGNAKRGSHMWILVHFTASSFGESA